MSTISVILPVHNGDRYIEQSLRGIAAQGESVLEVVVIDDACTDGSIAIVEGLAKELPVPVRIIQTEGVGQSAARNAGAEIASGDYLAFLDQDDVWLDGHVASLTDCLDGNPASSMAYSDVNTIDKDGGLVLLRLNAQLGNAHPKGSAPEIIAADVMALPSATMIRRIDFLKLGGFDTSLQGYEDDDLYFRGFRAGWNPRYLEDARVNYRIHGAGSSMSTTFRASRLLFAEKIATTFPDNPPTHSHHIRDILVPRIRRSFMLDYAIALNTRDTASARKIASELRKFLKSATIRPRGRIKLKTGAGLWLMDHPKVARFLFTKTGLWFLRGLFPLELRLRD
jgi:glycosyltransferase involved in cell wall biosynthesis